MEKSGLWQLDMSLVQVKLDTLAEALVNKIEREWPTHLARLPFALGFFGLTVRLARITYRTVCYLCADQRLTEHDWRWYYTLCLPALNRTIVDGVFNVIFMLEDLENRSLWYHKSGWKEAEQQLARYASAYAGDPQWAEWLSTRRALLDQAGVQFGLTEQERSTKPDWPNPGRMVNYGVDPKALTPDRKFLQYLNDWFYRETSAQNHQSFFGFMHLGALLLANASGLGEEEKQAIESDFFPKHRAFEVSRSVILLLSLIAEIEHHFSFGLAPRVIELWTILIGRVPEAKEIYERRYTGFWPIVAT
jgi:hypothetical protein